jgi:hypothetical protein
MEWNNGTIFRCFISGDTPSIDAKLDIGQQELNNKVFIGIENYVLKPTVGFEDPDLAPEVILLVQNELQNFWAKASYIQLESYQLPPYIDYTSQNIETEEVEKYARNTTIFGRLPLIASPTLGNAVKTTESTFASDRVLNKDSILYEMINNPHALSNGRFKFRLLDQAGKLIPESVTVAGQAMPVPVKYIKSLSFTLVIYKPDNKYN